VHIIDAGRLRHFPGLLKVGAAAFALTATAEGLLTGHPAKQQTALVNGAVPLGG
jgi:hypothetical protein